MTSYGRNILILLVLDLDLFRKSARLELARRLNQAPDSDRQPCSPVSA
jgi:hypothetical protein